MGDIVPDKVLAAGHPSVMVAITFFGGIIDIVEE